MPAPCTSLTSSLGCPTRPASRSTTRTATPAHFPPQCRPRSSRSRWTSSGLTPLPPPPISSWLRATRASPPTCSRRPGRRAPRSAPRWSRRASATLWRSRVWAASNQCSTRPITPPPLPPIPGSRSWRRRATPAPAMPRSIPRPRPWWWASAERRSSPTAAPGPTRPAGAAAVAVPARSTPPRPTSKRA